MARLGKTSGEVAALLDVSTATIRNYVDRFGEYLSDPAKRSRGKRFSEDDIKILQKIAHLLRQGLRYAEVKEVFESEPIEGEILEADDFEPIPEPEPEPEPEPQQSDQRGDIAPLEFFDSLVDQLTDQHKREIEAKDDLIRELRSDKQRLQEQLDQLKKPWWQRIL
jgi:DNA-binding transcriptional MerR regulator